jgi:hypothetical protein
VGPAWQNDWVGFVRTGRPGVLAIANKVKLSVCDRWCPKIDQLPLQLHGRPAWFQMLLVATVPGSSARSDSPSFAIQRMKDVSEFKLS